VPAIWVQEESFPPQSPGWDSTQISFRYNWFDRNLTEVGSPEALIEPTWESDSYQTRVATTAWQFANALKIGDLVTFGMTWHQAWIGRIVGDYTFVRDGATHRHSRKIEMIAHFEDRLSLPKELWELFRGYSRIVADDPQVQRLAAVLSQPAPVPESVLHRLFDGLSGNILPPELGDLVLSTSEDMFDTAELSACERCSLHCTELVYVDLLNDAVNQPLYPWTTFSEIRTELTDALGDPWLERKSDETNLSLARRYIDIRREDWSGDLDTPVLLGVRRNGVERWVWTLVHFSGGEAFPTLIGQVFPSREAAESHLATLGFRSSGEITGEQLRLLGIENPMGLEL
jgi:hypothetical protein